MKKLIVLLLAALTAFSFLTTSVFADDNSRIAPEVMELIREHDEGGAYVTITYHYPEFPITALSAEEAAQNGLEAQRRLLMSIDEISYFEINTFDVLSGKVDVGLPYSSIEAAAALDGVDYISMPVDMGYTAPWEQKCDSWLLEVLGNVEADEPMQLNIWLAYNSRAYIGFSDEDCVTKEEIDRYNSESRRIKREYYTAKNNEFYEIIARSAKVEALFISQYTPLITVSATAGEVEKIASLPQVGSVYYQFADDDMIAEPTVPDEWPTEIIDPPANDDLQQIEQKFRGWLDEVLPVDADNIEYEQLFNVPEKFLLIRCYLPFYEPWEYVGHFRIGSRVLTYWRPGAAVYPYGLFIYDRAEDRFIAISDADPGKYNLEKVLEWLGIGLLYGDADFDGEVSIMDATRIQRLLASLITEDDISLAAADVDEDDAVTVMDATRIQRYLAGLCALDGTQSGSGETDNSGSKLRIKFKGGILDPRTVAVFSAEGGKAPYQYKFTILGGVHAYSDYGDDFGDYHNDGSVEPIPGDFRITTGYTDKNETTIPTDSLTDGDYYTLIIEAKDAEGREAETLTYYFINNRYGVFLLTIDPSLPTPTEPWPDDLPFAIDD